MGALGENSNNGLESRVFSIVEENPPIPGCTISGSVLSGLQVFSLASGTDISAESYPVDALQLNLAGLTRLVADTATNLSSINLSAGQFIVKPAHTNIGINAEEDSVYIEVDLGKEPNMNEAIKPGEVFELAQVVPYQDGKIVNMDIAKNDAMKFVVMAFDEGCALSEHAAPGDAIVFALEGKGVIGYEGEEYPIEAGQNFRFAKGGLHSVKANGKFKMALLLTLK